MPPTVPDRRRHAVGGGVNDRFSLCLPQGRAEACGGHGFSQKIPVIQAPLSASSKWLEILPQLRLSL
jgi:hypothetical protein